MNNIFIIVPRLDHSSPIKGAKAIANNLSKLNRVYFISLYENIVDLKFEKKIILINLNKKKNIYRKIRYINKILYKLKNHENIKIISFCLAADIVNVFLKPYAKKFSSIRGNYKQNYFLRFGFFGLLLFSFHKFFLKKIKNLIVMNDFMKNNFNDNKINYFVVNNFIEENNIQIFNKKLYKNNTLNILFIGTLNKNKKIILLLDAVIKMLHNHYKVKLTIIGNGNLFNKINNKIKKNYLHKYIKTIKFIEKPFNYISQSDVTVSPSLYEGTSRAVLESLYIGTPCILRDTSDNYKLIKSQKQGLLFKNDSDLYNTLCKFYNNNINKNVYEKNCLLDKEYREFKVIEILNKVLN